MLGKISKSDIMHELAEHFNNYLEIVNEPVKVTYNLFTLISSNFKLLTGIFFCLLTASFLGLKTHSNETEAENV